jgi:predicted nucleotide-binding protein
MDKREAIKLLRQKSNKALHIASLHYLNSEYLPWRRNIEDILEATFTVNSTEYKRVANIRSGITKGTRAELQRAYAREVALIQLEVNSIIQKYEDLGIGAEQSITKVSPESVFREVPPSVFISHGKESAALRKLKEFIETLGIEPLIIKKRASLDKDVPDKIDLYLSQADFVIILATGDDTVRDKKTGTEIVQPRQNVIHEIGLAQKTHPGRVIYLLEEGASFPSDIKPRVYEPFKQRNMLDAFLGIIRELRAYGILKVTKYPVE